MRSRNKAGDAVTAEISETVTYERTVIFPKNTKIYGHLVRASSARSGKGSALFVQFDKAILRNGQEVMMNAGIQALVAGRTPVRGDAVPASGMRQTYPRPPTSSGRRMFLRPPWFRRATNCSRNPVLKARQGAANARWREQTRHVDAGQPGRFGRVGHQGVHPAVGRLGRHGIAVDRQERSTSKRERRC